MKKINEIRISKKISLGNYQMADIGVTISVDDTEIGDYLDIFEDTIVDLYGKIYFIHKMVIQAIDSGISIDDVKKLIEKEKTKLTEIKGVD